VTVGGPGTYVRRLGVRGPSPTPSDDFRRKRTDDGRRVGPGAAHLARTRYEIILRGRLGPRLETAIEGFEAVSSSAETTRLVGWVTDQAALQGALRRVSDFGLELVSIRELTEC